MKYRRFCGPCHLQLEIWWMTSKNNRAPPLYYVKLCASFRSHQCIETAITVWKNSIRVKIGIFVPCELEIWRMTLKNNRTPLQHHIKLRASFQTHQWIQTLLSHIKLCASFHRHLWIQIGVTLWKRLNWVLTSVTLTLELYSWPFAWTSFLSLVITPENFVMIRWWEHSEKGARDRRSDEQTDGQKCS